MKKLKEQYTKEIIPEMQKAFEYAHVLSVPRLEKAVVNIGIGRIGDNKEREEIKKMIAMITGQKAQDRPTNKSIATFKTRAGAIVGYRVTLRGERMYDFITRLIHTALPRMRDFRGIPKSSVDQAGNIHIGIPEHIIFPELIGEDLHRIYSLQVTIVSGANTRDEALKLFTLIGFPFEKEE